MGLQGHSNSGAGGGSSAVEWDDSSQAFHKTLASAGGASVPHCLPLPADVFSICLAVHLLVTGCAVWLYMCICGRWLACIAVQGICIPVQ